MSFGTIAAIIAAAALLLLVIFLIPAILSIKKTADSVSSLAELLTNELKPTIIELKQVLIELKTVGGGIAEHTDDVKCFMSALGETGTQLSLINRSVGVVNGMIGQVGAVATGFKVGGKYLLEQYLRRKMKGE